jgi:hypothetical protein
MKASANIMTLSKVPVRGFFSNSGALRSRSFENGTPENIDWIVGNLKGVKIQGYS